MIKDRSYSWAGKFKVDATTYIEQGINNKGKKEHNEAYLYFVPSLNSIIYKSTKSIDPDSSSENPIYIEYNNDNFIYLKKCEKP